MPCSFVRPRDGWREVLREIDIRTTRPNGASPLLLSTVLHLQRKQDSSRKGIPVLRDVDVDSAGGWAPKTLPVLVAHRFVVHEFIGRGAHAYVFRYVRAQCV